MEKKFADKTRTFSINKDNILATLDHCPPLPPNIATNNAHNYMVSSVNLGPTFDNQCKSFCSYPNNTFSYETPPNSAFQSHNYYPTWNPYFPGHGQKRWRIPFLPSQQKYAVADTGITQIVGASQSGKVDVSGSGAAASAAIKGAYTHVHPPTLPSQMEQYAIGAHIMGPGEQEILPRIQVGNNRYNGQKIKSNIYMKNPTSRVEPYTNSLYQTPGDVTKNLISTGIMRNTNTGETFETFENQMPPPNTKKGEIPQYQLKQISPRLLHLQGGWNHHNPRPRKKEQDGSVFNPVSERGGANPFGNQVYGPEIRKQMNLLVSRDLFNNRNGDQVAEPSLYGDKPAGYVGFVPRNRFRPYLPSTQELNLHGRMQMPQNLNPDLTKREQYTGEVYSRKANVLVQRSIAPNTFLNGVEAVTQIPIASEHTHTQRDNEQGYITPACLTNGGAPIIVTQSIDRLGRISEGTTNPVNHGFAEFQPTVVPIDRDIRSKLSPDQTTRVSANPHQNTAGIITSEHGVRPSGKVNIAEASKPVGDISGILKGTGKLVKDTHKVRATQKGTVNSNRTSSISATPITSQNAAMVVQKTVRPTQKEDIVSRTNNIRHISSAGIIMDHQKVRDTQRHGESHPVASAQKQTTGSLLTASTTQVRSTQKELMQETFPTAAVSATLPQSYVHVDKKVKDTQRQTMPSYNRTAGGIDGERIGDSVGPQLTTTLQNRGKDEQGYTTQNKRVYDGVGGNSTRVIGDQREGLRDERVTMTFTNSGVINNPRIDRLIAPVRPTRRSNQEDKDLCDDDIDI